MTDTIRIDGDYENGDDEFHYDIYLRPWGSYWDDVEEEALPHLYDRLVSADDRRGQSPCRTASERMLRQ